MDESMYTDAELRLSRERSRKYLGTAKVKLQQIVRHPSISSELDPKNVERLCNIFRRERCRRLDLSNHVTATVAEHHLNEALNRAGQSTDTLVTNNPHGQYPPLDFGTNQVQCLHGQHRLKAGEEVLDPSDRWWIVELYLDSISSDLQATLVDEYSNERTPSDGEVYRKVRQYQHEANARLEDRWMTRLSSNKAKRLRQLSSHATVRAAFDSLLAIPALLHQGMMLGSLPRALAVDIPEEMVNGLQNLREYWSSLFEGDRTKMLRLDAHTVETLQLLAPGLSTKETRAVQGLVLSGEVFSNFTDAERRSIWRRLKRKKTIVPTLYTFFQDMWYLEACANGLKRLVTLGKYTATVKSALFAAYSPESEDGHCLIQTSETGFRQCSASVDDSKELAYRQLWLYAMRHYPQLGQKPEGDHLIAKQRCDDVDQRCLRDLAVLARKLGFKSSQIEELVDQSPDNQIARAALLKARGPDRYRYNSSIFDSLVHQIVGCFSQAAPIACAIPAGPMMETKARARCGLPRRKAQQFDRQSLFLDKLHDEQISVGKVTNFLVRRCVYLYFFGSPSCAPSRVPDYTAPVPPMSPLFVPDDSRDPPDLMRTSDAAQIMTRERDQPGGDRPAARSERYREQEEPDSRRLEGEGQDHGLRRTERQSPVQERRSLSCTTIDMEVGDMGYNRLSIGLDEPADDIRESNESNAAPTVERTHRDHSIDISPAQSAMAQERIARRAGTVEGENFAVQQPTSDEGTEEEEIDGEDGASEEVGTDHGTAALGDALELELARLQKEANERAVMDQTDNEWTQQPREEPFAERDQTGTEALDEGEPEQEAGEGTAQDGINLPDTESPQHVGSLQLCSREAEGARSPENGPHDTEDSRGGTTSSDNSVDEDARAPAETSASTRDRHQVEGGAAGGRHPEFEEIAGVDGESRGTKAVVARRKDTKQIRNAKWLPYDVTKRGRREQNIEQSIKQGKERRRRRRATEFEFAGTQVVPQTGADEQDQQQQTTVTSGSGTGDSRDAVIQPTTSSRRRTDKAKSGQRGKTARDIRKRRRWWGWPRPLDFRAANKTKRQSTAQRAPRVPNQGDPATVHDADSSAQDLGSSPKEPLDRQNTNQPAKEIDIDTVEQETRGEGVHASEHLPLRAGESAPHAPVPPVVSSRDVPEVLTGEEREAGTPDKHELFSTEAREAAAAKLEGRFPTAHSLSESSATEQRIPRPSVDASPRPSRQLSPIPGRSTKSSDQRERAQRVPTQIDIAAGIHGAPESQQVGIVGPGSSQETSSVAPRDESAASHSARKVVTAEAGSSTTTGVARKILTPRIVARPPRAADAQQAPRNAPASPVTIVFKARGEDGEWTKVHELDVDPSDPADPAAVERLARKDGRNRRATFYDKNLRLITPAQCYDAAIEDGTNTIFMDFGGELAVNEETLKSIARELEQLEPEGLNRKIQRRR